MLKTVLAGVTMLALAGGSFVYAQQRGDNGPRGHRWKMSEQDRGAMTDARIAALKAGLKLTPDQEKNWPALEKALRDRATMRSDRLAARASADKPRDPIERLKLRAETMTQRGTTMKQVADAAAPLYGSLDEGQKRRFTMLARLDGPRVHRGHHWRDHGGKRGMMHHRDHGSAGTGDNDEQKKPQ
jgi:zinc resistance-associated protein